jgi:hypothetical protein
VIGELVMILESPLKKLISIHWSLRLRTFWDWLHASYFDEHQLVLSSDKINITNIKKDKITKSNLNIAFFLKNCEWVLCLVDTSSNRNQVKFPIFELKTECEFKEHLKYSIFYYIFINLYYIFLSIFYIL